jgi:hypothetical protein
VRAPKAPPAPSWLIGRADSGGVPALLERLSASVPIDSIDELWLFPTRRLTGVESTVLVLSLYTDEHDRRRVATVHFKATRNKRGEATVETVLEDHAVAPADRLTRVIDGVLRRLGDDLSSTPRAARISGEDERYEALIEAIASNIELEDALERVRERPARIADHGSQIAEQQGGGVGGGEERMGADADADAGLDGHASAGTGDEVRN